MFECFRSSFDLLALFTIVYKQSSRDVSGELLWSLKKVGSVLDAHSRVCMYCHCIASEET